MDYSGANDLGNSSDAAKRASVGKVRGSTSIGFRVGLPRAYWGQLIF